MCASINKTTWCNGACFLTCWPILSIIAANTLLLTQADLFLQISICEPFKPFHDCMLLADTMCLLISTICGRYLWMVSSSQMIATWVTAFLICPLEAYLANCFFLSWYLLLCFKPFLGSYQKRILVSSKLIVTIGLLSGISAIKNWYHCHTAIACGFKTGSKMRTVFGRQYVNNYFVWFCFGVRNLVLNLEPLLDLPLFFFANHMPENLVSKRLCCELLFDRLSSHLQSPAMSESLNPFESTESRRSSCLCRRWCHRSWNWSCHRTTLLPHKSWPWC